MSISSHSLSIPETPRSSREIPFSRTFFDKNNATSRQIYLRTFISGCILVIVLIFAVFPIYWGALWKTPVGKLNGWVVDFDGGVVGQTVVKGLTTGSNPSVIRWHAVNASDFPGGTSQLRRAVVNQKAWVAIAIREGATARLQSSYISPNASYSGLDAIDVYADEARNENAYRSLIRPSFQSSLQIISQSFALQSVKQLTASSSQANLTLLLSASPQTILTPISYTLHNLVPFDVPVATAVTFVGLIYQLILAFFVVMIGYSIREISGLNRFLTLRSLIVTRFVSSFVAFFVISLFYSLLTLAFQVDFGRRFGSSGFVIFWMVNWVGMLSVGLALEALITILTPKFLPFFMIVWIVVNVSVPLLPIEILPVVFHYGYATPFYNISHAVRCILFGTKNTLGLNFGILIVWVAISCTTLPLMQWIVRRKDVIAERAQVPLETSGPGRESRDLEKRESRIAE